MVRQEQDMGTIVMRQWVEGGGVVLCVGFL